MGIPQHAFAARMAEENMERKYGPKALSGTYGGIQVRQSFEDGYFFALKDQGIPNERWAERVRVTPETLTAALREVIENFEAVKEHGNLALPELCEMAAVTIFRHQRRHTQAHAVIRKALQNLHARAVVWDD